MTWTRQLEKVRLRGWSFIGWILKTKMARVIGRFVLGYERADPRTFPEPFYLSKVY